MRIFLTDGPPGHRCVAATRPDAIVHAIWNDPTMLVSDRRLDTTLARPRHDLECVWSPV